MAKKMYFPKLWQTQLPFSLCLPLMTAAASVQSTNYTQVTFSCQLLTLKVPHV